MARKRLVDVVRDVMRSELDTWGSDQVVHFTPCEIQAGLKEILKMKRISIQERHLIRYVLRFVTFPSLDEFNAYLNSFGEGPVTQSWLTGIARADLLVPWFCKRYAAIGPCIKHEVLRAGRFL
jgi:hypothetical protein